MHDFLEQLGIHKDNSGAFAGGWISEPGGDWLDSVNPATGEVIARVKQADEADYERIVSSAQEAFTAWRTLAMISPVAGFSETSSGPVVSTKGPVAAPGLTAWMPSSARMVAGLVMGCSCVRRAI